MYCIYSVFNGFDIVSIKIYVINLYYKYIMLLLKQMVTMSLPNTNVKVSTQCIKFNLFQSFFTFIYGIKCYTFFIII